MTTLRIWICLCHRKRAGRKGLFAPTESTMLYQDIPMPCAPTDYLTIAGVGPESILGARLGLDRVVWDARAQIYAARAFPDGPSSAFSTDLTLEESLTMVFRGWSA